MQRRSGCQVGRGGPLPPHLALAGSRSPVDWALTRWDTAGVAVTPFIRVDHLVIAVRDLEAATASYAAVLGREPSWRGEHPAYGTANALFGLANCYVELLALATDAPTHPVGAALAAYLARRSEGLFALALGSDDLDATAAHLRQAGLTPSPIADGEGRAADGTRRRWRSFVLARDETRGVNVLAITHADGAGLATAPATSDPATVVDGVDHVVLFSDDLDGALALWRDVFGVGERWRREFPERGTVNVGLRLGGVTLELVAPLAGGAAERGERLWGVAYTVADCDATVARLRTAGMPIGDARPGLAPNTRVVTVKRDGGVPTLLIEHQR